MSTKFRRIYPGDRKLSARQLIGGCSAVLIVELPETSSAKIINESFSSLIPIPCRKTPFYWVLIRRTNERWNQKRI